MHYGSFRGCGERLRRSEVKLFFAWFLLCTILFGACPAHAGAAGDVVDYRQIGVYTKERLNKVFGEELKGFDQQAAPPFPAAGNGVKLYKVHYTTARADGKEGLSQVSGLIAIPDLPRGRFPVLSYQHATTFAKQVTASNPETLYEARAAIAAFGAHGFVVLMADYLGKGDSEGSHPFFIAASEASASLDMIRAGKKVCAALGVDLAPDLFLSGWSQGGHSTLALLRVLEREGYPGIRAAASFGGAYDLCALWDAWRNTKTVPSATPFIGYLLQAYERFQGLDGLCAKAMNSPYDSYALESFDRDVPAGVIFEKFPSQMSDLLRKDFAAAGCAGNGAFSEALARNNVLGWQPKTPLRLYYGDADTLIPPEIARMAYSHLKATGADVTLKSAGAKAGHQGTYIFGLFDTQTWFDSLRTTPEGR